MSTQTPTRHDSTASDRGSDPRANYILAGIDENGSHHVYRTIDETVHVVTPEGDREHVQDLGGRSIHEWLTFVADVRSWTDQYLVDSFADFLAAATDGDA